MESVAQDFYGTVKTNGIICLLCLGETYTTAAFEPEATGKPFVIITKQTMLEGVTKFPCSLFIVLYN